jgi:hypothetical protein
MPASTVLTEHFTVESAAHGPIPTPRTGAPVQRAPQPTEVEGNEAKADVGPVPETWVYWMLWNLRMEVAAEDALGSGLAPPGNGLMPQSKDELGLMKPNPAVSQGSACDPGRLSRSSHLIPEEFDIRHIEWPREQKALRDIDALGSEPIPLLGVLNSLGNRGEPEYPPQLDEGMNDRRGFLGLGHSGHERLIDLQHVDRELPQIGQ